MVMSGTSNCSISRILAFSERPAPRRGDLGGRLCAARTAQRLPICSLAAYTSSRRCFQTL